VNKHAIEMLLMLSAMKTLRNATNALKEVTVATLPPSAPLLAESHTESATQELESAHHAIQRPITIAPKLRRLAIKNAQSNPCQSATKQPTHQNVRNAHQVSAASQLLLANKHANTTHTQPTTHTNAHGMPLNQNAFKRKMVP